MPRQSIKIKRICQQCQKEFFVTPSTLKKDGAKFCSKSCSGYSKRNTTTNCTCERCGKEFYCKPSRIAIGKGRFCSQSCFKGHNHISRVCQRCSKTFLVHESSVRDGGALFCSKDCYNPRRHMSLEEKFFDQIGKKTPSGCILWNGVCRNGYGIISHKSHIILAHRASYDIFNGPIPDGLFVLHKCDNPQCISPMHLFIGTHQDNMADKVSKNRQTVGEDNAIPKLIAADVLEIRRRRANGESPKKLATEFGITDGHVWNIVTRKNWKHL